MSSRRNHRDKTITFTCDQCGETHEADTDDFHDAIEEIKDSGWRPTLECGEWLHLCEDCK